MKQWFSKLFFAIGGFFFWLSLIMVLLFITELLVLPDINSFNTPKAEYDYRLKGGCYTYSGDVSMKIGCGGIGNVKKTSIVYFLNIPGDYIAIATLLPIFTLDTLERLGAPPLIGRQAIDSLDDISFLVWMFPVWLLAVISICYYIGKNIKGIVRKIKDKS